MRHQRGAAKRWVAILAVLIVGAAIAAQQLGYFKSIASSDRVAAGGVDIELFDGNRLRDLVIGIPEGTANVGEARTAFAPDEKMILHGAWVPDPTRNSAIDWEWYGPDGRLVYQSSMEVKADWRNTWNTYRGPQPLAAGDYTVVLLERGQRVGAIGFKVVREESAIPVRAMAKAFESSKLTAEQATQLALGARAIASAKKSVDEIVSGIPADVASRGIGLAIGLYQDGKQVLVKLGEGETFGQSAKTALGAISTVEGLDPAKLTIEVSVLHSGLEISPRHGSVNAHLSGNVGFSLEVGDKRATMLPSHIFSSNLKEPVDVLRQVSIDAGLAESGYEEAGAKLRAFKSQEYVLTPGAEAVSELLNGRAAVRPETLSHDQLMKAVDRAINWYITNQQPEGNYMYSFIPGRDEFPADDWCLRVLNTVFVMAEFAIARPDRPEVRASVERAIDLYAGSLQKNENGLFVNWRKARADSGLGSTAFLVGAMAILGREKDRATMEQLALAIIGEQDPSGRYSTSFIGEDRDIDQQYYPGEAMLGLMRYYRATKDERAKNSVAKAYDYYRKYWSWEKHGPYVPWQIRAYLEVHETDPDPKYVTYAFELMDWMLDEMPPLPLSTGLAKAGALERMFASTGVYTEGLVAAYMMAKRVGDKERIDRYGKAMVGCARYVLGLQYKETDVYPFARPEKLLGAMATKPRDNKLRLDFTYHGMSAVNTITQIMTAAEWEQLRGAAFN